MDKVVKMELEDYDFQIIIKNPDLVFHHVEIGLTEGPGSELIHPSVKRGFHTVCPECALNRRLQLMKEGEVYDHGKYKLGEPSDDPLPEA